MKLSPNEIHTLMILAGLGCLTLAAIVVLLLVGIHDTKKLNKLRDEQHREGIIRRLAREDQAQDLTEYALLLVLVCLVAIGTMQTLGSAVAAIFSNAASNLMSGT